MLYCKVLLVARCKMVLHPLILKQFVNFKNPTLVLMLDPGLLTWTFELHKDLCTRVNIMIKSIFVPSNFNKLAMDHQISSKREILRNKIRDLDKLISKVKSIGRDIQNSMTSQNIQKVKNISKDITKLNKKIINIRSEILKTADNIYVTQIPKVSVIEPVHLGINNTMPVDLLFAEMNNINSVNEKMNGIMGANVVRNYFYPKEGKPLVDVKDMARIVRETVMYIEYTEERASKSYEMLISSILINLIGYYKRIKYDESGEENFLVSSDINFDYSQKGNDVFDTHRIERVLYLMKYGPMMRNFIYV